MLLFGVAIHVFAWYSHFYSVDLTFLLIKHSILADKIVQVQFSIVPQIFNCCWLKWILHLLWSKEFRETRTKKRVAVVFARENQCFIEIPMFWSTILTMFSCFFMVFIPTFQWISPFLPQTTGVSTAALSGAVSGAVRPPVPLPPPPPLGRHRRPPWRWLRWETRGFPTENGSRIGRTMRYPLVNKQKAIENDYL